MDKPRVREDRNLGSSTGRDAETPLDMPVRGWRQVALRAWRRSWQDNIGLVAAGAAFYGFIAFVPLMIASILTFSMVADPAHLIRGAHGLALFMPMDGVAEVQRQLTRLVDVSDRARGAGIIVAAAVAFFGARNAATALIAALNIAYGEREQRNFRRLTVTALAIAFAAFLFAFAALLAMSVLATIRSFLPDSSDWAILALRVVAGALLLLGAAAAASTLYRYAPCRSRAKWDWVAPGSLVAAGGLMLLTLGFGTYVNSFGTYATNYGPSASAMVLLVWLYLSTVIFLFGAEVNAELEHQTEKDTTEGSAKPVGQRGATTADDVADGSEINEEKTAQQRA